MFTDTWPGQLSGKVIITIVKLVLSFNHRTYPTSTVHYRLQLNEHLINLFVLMRLPSSSELKLTSISATTVDHFPVNPFIYPCFLV